MAKHLTLESVSTDLLCRKTLWYFRDMRFPVFTIVRWIFAVLGALHVILGIGAILVAAFGGDNLANVSRVYSATYINLFLVIIGAILIVYGLILIGISEIIGLVMTAENSLYRIANAIEGSNGLPGYMRNSPPFKIQDAHKALSSAFGTKESNLPTSSDSFDKYRPTNP